RPGAAGARQGGQPPPAPRPRHRRPRLRPRQVSARAPPTTNHARDRPPPDRARLRPRSRSLGRRAHLRLAAPLQAATHPLRPPPRDPRSVPRPRLLPRLLQETPALIVIRVLRPQPTSITPGSSFIPSIRAGSPKHT